MCSKYYAPVPIPLTCRHLSLTDQLTDLLLDMSDTTSGGPLTKRVYKQFNAFIATIYERVASGQATTVRKRSRIWDEPVVKVHWYGRRDVDELPLRQPSAALRKFSKRSSSY